jgi:high-affinity nickel permease
MSKRILFRWLPAASALVVATAGVFISSQAFGQTGVQIPVGLLTTPITLDGAMKAGALSILGLGFVLGLKHALDSDHLIAVSTIVSERKGFLSSSIVGLFWGLGHTASLLIVGLVMIALHIQIPEKVAQGMEFAVAAMLIALGINVIVKLIRGGTIHVHVHSHKHHPHMHPHIHSHDELHAHEVDYSHIHLGISSEVSKRVSEVITRIVPSGVSGLRPVLIGMVHGLAGSAALMLAVLATINSPSLALLYIGVFGLGSVGGMLVMSTLIGIPFVLTAARSDRLNLVVRGLSGIISVGFGLFYAWQIGFVGGLFL